MNSDDLLKAMESYNLFMDEIYTAQTTSKITYYGVKSSELSEVIEPVDYYKDPLQKYSDYMVSTSNINYYTDGLPQLPIQQEPMQPNTLATNNKWSTKVAWSSYDLFKLQKDLNTYSSDTAMLITVIVEVVNKLVKATLEAENIQFAINAGSPIYNNTHKITVIVTSPIAITFFVTRKLDVDTGVLRWSVDIIADLNNISNIIDITIVNGKPQTKELKIPKTRRLNI